MLAVQTEVQSVLEPKGVIRFSLLLQPRVVAMVHKTVLQIQMVLAVQAVRVAAVVEMAVDFLEAATKEAIPQLRVMVAELLRLLATVVALVVEVLAQWVVMVLEMVLLLANLVVLVVLEQHR